MWLCLVLLFQSEYPQMHLALPPDCYLSLLQLKFLIGCLTIYLFIFLNFENVYNWCGSVQYTVIKPNGFVPSEFSFSQQFLSEGGRFACTILFFHKLLKESSLKMVSLLINSHFPIRLCIHTAELKPQLGTQLTTDGLSPCWNNNFNSYFQLTSFLKDMDAFAQVCDSWCMTLQVNLCVGFFHSAKLATGNTVKIW